MQAGRHRERDHAREEPRRFDADRAELEGAADERIGQGADVGAEISEGRVAQEERETEGAEDLRQHRPAHDVAHQPEVADDAQCREQQRRRWDREQRSTAHQRVDHDRDVHAQHDEVAMGEVDHVHHPPDQRQPRREQCVDCPEQQPADDHLEEDRGHYRPSPSEGDGAAL